MRLSILFLAVLTVQAQRIVDAPELTGKPTKPRKEPTEVMMAFYSEISKGGNKTAEMMPMVSTFIQAHPSFGDAYSFRVLGQYCELHQPASEAFIADVNKAIQYFTPDGLTGKQPELYGMRARLEYDLGRFPASLDDLEKGLRLSPANADDVMKVGAVKPGSRAEEENLCAWTQTELDNLSQRFPKDYRIPLLRGLYLSKLTFYRTEGGDALVPKAIEEFQKALAMNPRSALAHYFMGRLHESASFWDPKAIASEDVKQAGMRRATAEYTLAITLDPNLKDAIASRAGEYLNLKQYASAVRDYDRAITLDPANAGLYHDRALAKSELGNHLSALIDFDEAIRRDTLSDSGAPNAYENRGDEHMKLGQYKEATADFTQLIKLRLDGEVFLTPLTRLRALYPEYSAVPDDVFLKKFHDLFFPKYDEKEFAKHITQNDPFADFLLTEAYERRTDAYLKDLRFRKAVADYHRAIATTDNDGRFVERWRSIGMVGKEEQFLDMKSVTFAPNPTIWIKTTKPKGYDLESLDFDCTNKKLRSLAVLTYDDDGNVLKSSDGNRVFQSVIPETVGENLLTGTCLTE